MAGYRLLPHSLPRRRHWRFGCSCRCFPAGPTKVSAVSHTQPPNLRLAGFEMILADGALGGLEVILPNSTPPPK